MRRIVLSQAWVHIFDQAIHEAVFAQFGDQMCRRNLKCRTDLEDRKKINIQT